MTPGGVAKIYDHRDVLVVAVDVEDLVRDLGQAMQHMKHEHIGMSLPLSPVMRQIA